jgi:hypothetical protein
MAVAVEMVRPTLVVYVVENTPLTRDRPTIPDTITNAELLQHGYTILPSLVAPNLAQKSPRDVGGVWNADRRMSVQQHSRADVLWMCTVEYTLDKTSRADSVSGTVSVVARALDANTGESLWYGRVANRPLKGATLAEAGRLALAEIIPALVADFDRAPKIRTWMPPERPQTLPPGATPGTRTPFGPTMTPAPTPGSSGQPYSGVVIVADHLPVQPSFRSGIYSPQGAAPIYGAEKQRMSWSESMASARQQAGPNPLVLRAQSSQGGKIVLRENDARVLQREKAVLERRPPTVVVRPPKR